LIKKRLKKILGKIEIKMFEQKDVGKHFETTKLKQIFLSKWGSSCSDIAQWNLLKGGQKVKPYITPQRKVLFVQEKQPD
jgi:hypothetical protein